MKTILKFAIVMIMPLTLWAQSPEKISYQAVIRNADNELVSNKVVGMQISILQGAADGNTVYVETHTPSTNVNGLVSIEVGAGTVVSSAFASIDWADGPFFIKTETDPTGGTNYTITGTSQLLSVPYALYTKTSGSSIPWPSGPVGNGITSTTDNSDSTLTFTFDDGTTFTTLNLKRAQGERGLQGERGVQGEQGAASAYVYKPYSNSADGSGFVATYNGQVYMGFLASSNVYESVDGIDKSEFN
mgnify:CR=1 FL=1